MCRTGVEPVHLQPEYAHELYSPETMLATQSHGSAFLLGAQPVQTHPFHGFQLKQESEPASSDESSFGEHGGVIRKGLLVFGLEKWSF